MGSVHGEWTVSWAHGEANAGANIPADGVNVDEASAWVRSVRWDGSMLGYDITTVVAYLAS